MKTKFPIHPDWLSQTVTRFYHFSVIGWKIVIYPEGNWEGDKP
jgi:hypothetical protein